MDTGGDVPQQPMIPGSSRRIRVIHDEGEALRSFRFPSPGRRRREIVALAGEDTRDGAACGEPFDGQGKHHVLSASTWPPLGWAAKPRLLPPFEPASVDGSASR